MITDLKRKARRPKEDESTDIACEGNLTNELEDARHTQEGSDRPNVKTSAFPLSSHASRLSAPSALIVNVPPPEYLWLHACWCPCCSQAPYQVSDVGLVSLKSSLLPFTHTSCFLSSGPEKMLIIAFLLLNHVLFIN